MRGRELLGALAERPFRLLWLGRTTSGVGDSLVPVALAFAVLQIGTARDLGFVLATTTVARVALTLVGGVWADRLSRRLVMVGADLVRAGVYSAVAVLLLAGVAEPWHLAVLLAIAGGASAFFVPASTGLIPETVSPGRLQQANALLGLSENATNILGPALAGILVAATQPAWAFAVNAGSFAGSAAFLLALRLVGEERPARQRFVVELAEGWREVTSRTWLWTSFLLFALGNAIIATLFVLGPIVAERDLGGAADWGLILSGGAVGGVLGGLLALRYRPVRPLLVGFPLVGAVGLELAALAPPLPVLAIAVSAALAWGSIALAGALWDTVLQQHIPRHALSRVSSYDWMISLVFQPLGFVIAAPLSNAIGLDAALVLLAALMVAVNLLILAVPSVRRLRRRDAVEAEPAPAT